MNRVYMSNERGQTTTEYMMILGLTAAMIMSLERIVIPTMRWVVSTILVHMATCLSSVAPGCVPN